MTNDALQADRVYRARLRMLAREPFWGTLGLCLRVVATREIPTACTNGTHLLYNPDYVAGQTDAELEGLLAEETMHCAQNHMGRLGGRQPKLFNIACDYAILKPLTESGFAISSDALVHDGRYDDMSAEEIYQLLLRDAKPQKGGMAGEFCRPDEHTQGETVDQAEVEEMWGQALFQAVKAAGDKSPAWAKRRCDELKTPKVDWKAVLRDFAVAAQNHDHTWLKPQRRFIGKGLYLPSSVIIKENRGLLICDTSGSIGQRELTACVSEMQGILDEGLCSAVQLAWADTRIFEGELFENGDRIVADAKGHGGTNFDAAMAWAKEQEEFTFLVFFTDMATMSYGDDPGIPVLWAHHGGYHYQPPPFGTVMTITTED